MNASVRIFTPENRLAKTLTSLEGSTAEELVGDAKTRVARLETAIRTYVREKLTQILAYAGQSEEMLFAQSRRLGELACDVADVAGAAGLSAIGEVASGINAMVEGLITTGAWHTDALRLHIDTLALLNAPGAAAANDVVVDRLRALRQAIGVAE